MSLKAITFGSALGIMLFFQCNCDTLRMIAVISRHGDRSPAGSYKNDPHANHDWYGGVEALSLEGYAQTYKLGQTLRARYKSLLPENGLYTKEVIHVESSVTERTIMSVQCVLAGLLPLDVESYLLRIQWQPAAIHVLPKDEDYKLMAHKKCPKYDKQFVSLITHPDLIEEYQELFDYLTEHTGDNIAKKPWFASILYDTLTIQQKANLTLPDWANATVIDKLKPFGFKFQLYRTHTEFMKKMKGGPLVTEIVTNMEKKVSNTLYPNRRIFLYSAHDITITSVVNALGVQQETTNGKKPDYGAALVFELHQNDEVKLVYYSNYGVETPQEVSIPNCGPPCLLTKFREEIKPIEMKIEDYDEWCKITE